MKLLKFKSYGQEVLHLEEILVKLGYEVRVSKYFGKDSLAAIKDFQSKNRLVIDGIVGPKTWSKLIVAIDVLTGGNDKFLAEKDLINFAANYDLELAIVKAVNEVESQGKGFHKDGRPKILFEGHIFWRQLKARGINPHDLTDESNQMVLYEEWTTDHYLWGSREYDRLNQAKSLKNSKKVRDAANCSASWGSFQIMGFHWEHLGYSSINDFVKKMGKHERDHLDAFGRYIHLTKFKGKRLTHWLKAKDWKKFAKAYNGSEYWRNKYDEKLQKAYNKYQKF